MASDDDHDAWWAQLPEARKAQIRRWLAKNADIDRPTPGQLPLIRMEGRNDGDLKNHR